MPAPQTIIFFHCILGLTSHSLFSLSLSLSQPSFSTTNTHPFSPRPFQNVHIDYSAANEYMESHYGRRDYFPTTPDKNQKKDTVYNGREGIYDDVTGECHQPTTTFSRNGIALLPHKSTITNWNNLNDISSIYLKELRDDVIPQLFPDESKDGRVINVIFWQAMLRGNDLSLTTPQKRKVSSRTTVEDDAIPTPTSPVAPLAHIDTDVRAYGIEGFIRLVQNNLVGNEPFPLSQVTDALLLSQKRFVIVNVWRNIDKTYPIEQSPLAVLATKYVADSSSGDGSDNKSYEWECFPDATLDLERSRWYTFPDMTHEEILVFKQYDRDGGCLSDLWHCAIDLTSGQENNDENSDGDNDDWLHDKKLSGYKRPRHSFDIRMLVILDEDVPDDYDRLRRQQKTPLLMTLEESGCFCDEQASRRGFG